MSSIDVDQYSVPFVSVSDLTARVRLICGYLVCSSVRGSCNDFTSLLCSTLCILVKRVRSIPISTALAVVGATAFPQHVGRLAPAGDLLGKLFLFIFFATAGASGGKLSDAFAFTPIFMYLGLLYLVHLGIMLTVWKVRDNDLAGKRCASFSGLYFVV